MLPNKRGAMQTTQTEKGTASARTEAGNHTCSGRFDITTANTKCKTNTTISKRPKQNDRPYLPKELGNKSRPSCTLDPRSSTRKGDKSSQNKRRTLMHPPPPHGVAQRLLMNPVRLERMWVSKGARCFAKCRR